MSQKRQNLICSPIGSVFSAYSDELLEEIKNSESFLIGVTGKVSSPGIYEAADDTTLAELIAMAGGLLDGADFKAAQLGIPFGGFLTHNDLETPITPDLFEEGIARSIIILSAEDCIVQYARFYLDYLIGRLKEGNNVEFMDAKDEIFEMDKLVNRIAKGRANMRDVFLLRELAASIKEKVPYNQNIIEEILSHFYEEVSEHVQEGYCRTSQCNHLTKLSITNKCIGCNACTKVCPVDCILGGFKEQHTIDFSRCTHCGACASVCPTHAITSGDNSVLFLRDLATPHKTVITQMAPSVRVAIGEAFGFEAGVNVENKIAAGLKLLGVDYVFDTTWAADLTIMEEAAEFEDRLKRYFNGDKSVRLPILTSCCPAWVKFIEMNYGDMLDIPSSAKSPMEMFAAVAKDIWGKQHNLKREEIVSVAIMPCLAKKYEASRPEFSRGLNYDVDYVITTEELIKIFKASEIDLATIEDGSIDPIMGEYTGAGIIFGRTGGVIEACVRNVVEDLTGQRLGEVEFDELRGFEGFRSCTLNDGGLNLRIGVAHGLKEAGIMLDKIRSGEEFYHAIEIMACTGGCIGGGGQPKVRKRLEVLKMRMDGINEIDRSLNLRRSSENPAVQELYSRFLEYPLSHKAHELLHTEYFARQKKYPE